MQSQIHATLERIATLRKILLRTCSSIIYCKSVVVGIGQVPAPKANLKMP